MENSKTESPNSCTVTGKNLKRSFKCTHKNCDKSYFNHSHLKRHINTSHYQKVLLKLQCEYCEGYFSNKDSLKVHFQRFHGESAKNCGLCNRVFKKENLYQEHMILFHHLKGDILESYECELCGKKLISFRRFKKHKKNHLLKQFKCTYNNCSATFHSVSLLVEHEKNCHYIVKKYHCAECDKKFKTKSNLTKHIFNHFNENNFICPYENCIRSYSHKKNLNQHIRIFHLGKKFECEICKTELSTNQKLNQHIIKIHKI